MILLSQDKKDKQNNKAIQQLNYSGYLSFELTRLLTNAVEGKKVGVGLFIYK